VNGKALLRRFFAVHCSSAGRWRPVVFWPDHPLPFSAVPVPGTAELSPPDPAVACICFMPVDTCSGGVVWCVVKRNKAAKHTRPLKCLFFRHVLDNMSIMDIFVQVC